MTKSRTRLVIIAAVAVLILAALYLAWWQVMAGQWRKGIARWQEQMAAQGWTVTTGDIALTGFPGTMHIALPAPAGHDQAGNAWTGPPVALDISPVMPFEPRFTASGHHVFAMAGHAPLDVQAEQLTGRLTVGRGGPRAITVEAHQISAGDLILEGFVGEVRKLDAKPDDPTAPILAATAEIDRLALPEGKIPALDRTLSVAHLALRLRGRIPPGPPQQSLAAWRDAGGTVEIDSLDFDWPPLTGAGNATVALDPALQPELAGSVTVQGLTPLIDRMVQLGLMKPGAAVAAKVVLGLAATDGPDGMPENKAAVAIQNRVLTLGPAKIMTLPEMKW